MVRGDEPFRSCGPLQISAVFYLGHRTAAGADSEINQLLCQAALDFLQVGGLGERC